METLRDILKRQEGKRLQLYKCPAGKWTGGYGHNFDDNGISEETAEYILSEDIEMALNNLNRVFSDQELKYINQVRFNALASMMFQLGYHKFIEFRRMIAAIRDGDWVLAAAESMDSLWYTQCPNRAAEVVRWLQYGE